MSGFRLLHLIKPFGSLIPEVESPYTLDFDEKMVYTFVSGVLYLFMQFPLGGLKPNHQLTLADPFYWLRSVVGSEKGTLLEFGLLPVLTAGFVWQILSGLKLVQVNFNLKNDRQLFQTVQKLTSVVLSLVYALLLLGSHYFDQVDKPLQLAAQITVVFQLVAANLVVTLVVELLDKGYGFSSGALTLITVSAATNFAYNTIGVQIIGAGGRFGGDSVGSVINFIRNIRSRSIADAIIESFTRSNLSNLSQLYIALASIVAVLYLNNFRVELPIKNTKVRSMSSVYPIKLFYSGALPILFTYTVLYNLNIFGFALYKIFGSNFIANFQIDVASKSLLYPLNGGILYYISPSTISSASTLAKLIRPFTFAIFIFITSVAFSKLWTEISGSSAKDLAKTFKEQEVALLGHRDVAVARELNKIIPVAAATGAALLSIIVIVGEWLGGAGSNAAIVVSVISGLTILEGVMTEWQQNGGKGSSFAQVFNPNQ